MAASSTIPAVQHLFIYHYFDWYSTLMVSLTKASRINAARHVIQYMNEGMSAVYIDNILIIYRRFIWTTLVIQCGAGALQK